VCLVVAILKPETRRQCTSAAAREGLIVMKLIDSQPQTPSRLRLFFVLRNHQSIFFVFTYLFFFPPNSCKASEPAR
jgi:hypothetical protein